MTAPPRLDLLQTAGDHLADCLYLAAALWLPGTYFGRTASSWNPTKVAGQSSPCTLKELSIMY